MFPNSWFRCETKEDVKGCMVHLEGGSVQVISIQLGRRRVDAAFEEYWQLTSMS